MLQRKQWLAILGILAIAAVATAQFRFGRPPMRRHTANQRGELRLVPASETPTASARVEITEAGGFRTIRSTGVPDHPVGRFPNRGNPNPIRAQQHAYRVTLSPSVAETPSPVVPGVFGVAVNGTPFDPGAAEFWLGDRRSGWNYEALSAAVPLGLDANHAHVQPTGAYHYHGTPTGLLKKLGVDGESHSPLIGWAADGFPIYALYGFADPEDAASSIRALRPSYRLKSGERPGGGAAGGGRGPGGAYDGAFVADYEYAAGRGDLDECNGRRCVTPDFPDGTYAYFLTADWPVIPRQFRGTPDRSFAKGPRRRR